MTSHPSRAPQIPTRRHRLPSRDQYLAHRVGRRSQPRTHIARSGALRRVRRSAVTRSSCLCCATRSRHWWPPRGGGTGALSVRMRVHTGETQERDGDYFGAAVNRAAWVPAPPDGSHSGVAERARSMPPTPDRSCVLALGLTRRDVPTPWHSSGLPDLLARRAHTEMRR